jgi:hypothetical protein
MTIIARDIRTGAVVGQVTIVSHASRLYGLIRLLTRDGYVSVPTTSVRLEKVS